MTIATPASAGVSLAMLLAAKKRRAAPQAGWLAGWLIYYQHPVISLKLVTPVPIRAIILLSWCSLAWRR